METPAEHQTKCRIGHVMTPPCTRAVLLVWTNMGKLWLDTGRPETIPTLERAGNMAFHISRPNIRHLQQKQTQPRAAEGKKKQKTKKTGLVQLTTPCRAEIWDSSTSGPSPQGAPSKSQLRGVQECVARGAEEGVAALQALRRVFRHVPC